MSRFDDFVKEYKDLCAKHDLNVNTDDEYSVYYVEEGLPRDDFEFIDLTKEARAQLAEEQRLHDIKVAEEHRARVEQRMLAEGLDPNLLP